MNGTARSISVNMALCSIILSFLFMLNACSGGNLETNPSGQTPDPHPRQTPDPHPRQAASTDITSDSTSGSSHDTAAVSNGQAVNQIADREANQEANQETEKLKALDKAFLNSGFYRDQKMIPLTVTSDHKTFVAYKISNDIENKRKDQILIGMPRQAVELYLVSLDENRASKIGTGGFVINYAWSDDGKLLSLVSHKSVQILNVVKKRLSDVPLQYETDGIYNTSWGPDNRTLYIHLDTIANYYAYDAASQKMLKVRGRFTEGDVTYRGKAGGNVMTSKGERVGVAEGLYLGEKSEKLLFNNDVIIHDTDGSRILVSHESPNSDVSGTQRVLEDYDTATGKNRAVYEGSGAWKIYKASYLKTTGDIIYTTFETNENGVRYFLVRIGRDGNKTSVEVPSPLYTVMPGESFLHFAVFRDGQSCTLNTSNLTFIDGEGFKPENSEITSLMYRALDIYSSDTLDKEKIRRVFINSYDGVPQEALENILLEAEKAEYWKYSKLEIRKELTMAVTVKDQGKRASVVLNGLYFRSPHELIQKNGKWVITGFSTWPDSKERKAVYRACSRYIEKEIKSGKRNDIIKGPFTGVKAGEIEIWAMSEPHRAVYPDAYAKEARVKILVQRKDGSTEKFMAYFSKRRSGLEWKCQELGKLSPSLFPPQ